MLIGLILLNNYIHGRMYLRLFADGAQTGMKCRSILKARTIIISNNMVNMALNALLQQII